MVPNATWNTFDFIGSSEVGDYNFHRQTYHGTTNIPFCSAPTAAAQAFGALYSAAGTCVHAFFLPLWPTCRTMIVAMLDSDGILHGPSCGLNGSGTNHQADVGRHSVVFSERFVV
eukprot:SAG31_NODE_15380_length_758_cov_0.779970_2_plen_114_part_01